MAIIFDPTYEIISDILAADELNPGEPWDGRTIVPANTLFDPTVKIMAVTNRDILIKVCGMMVPADSLTVTSTEDIKPIHGASRPGVFGLPGGDIAINYSVEFGSWLQEGQVDALRDALFSGPGGRAVYHSVSVSFLGDPAIRHAGRHPLIYLGGCKAKSDSWVFSQGSVGKSKFDGIASRYQWYGEI